MRIYIIADMEGISGVSSIDLQAHPGAPLYEQSRHAMTEEVAACATGAFEGGADEVIVFDMHCDGLNLFCNVCGSGYDRAGTSSDLRLDGAAIARCGRPACVKQV